MARVRLNRSNSSSPLPQRIARCLGKALEHLQHRLAIGQEHVAPHGRVRRGDAGEVAETTGGIFDDFRLGDFLQVAGGADDRIGDQVRQVARHRQHPVVMVGGHQFDIGAQPPPELRDPLDGEFICAFWRGDDAPALLEQRGEARLRPAALGACDRMGGDDRRTGQRFGQRGEDRALAAAHVGHDRLGGQIVGELGGDHAHRADRNAQHDQIGIDHARARRVRDIVRQIERAHRLAHRRVGVIGGNPRGRHGFARRPRDRGADQAQPDDGDPREGQHQAPFASDSTIWRSAATTPFTSSSVPMVMRKAWPSPWLGSQRTM